MLLTVYRTVGLTINVNTNDPSNLLVAGQTVAKVEIFQYIGSCQVASDGGTKSAKGGRNQKD